MKEVQKMAKFGAMKGRLIYVIGASGSGKDTLIKTAENALADQPDIHFPRF